MKTAIPFKSRLLALITSNNKPNARFLFSHPAHFLAFGFGAGLSPKAPGTAGTLLGFPLFFLLSLLPIWLFWIALAALFAIGVWICGKAGEALGVSDHGGIVWDEIVAFALVLAFSPPALVWYGVAFALFRLFDIWKPFPIRYFDQNVKGGFGVMLDDLLAAGYAVAALMVIRFMVEEKSLIDFPF